MSKLIVEVCKVDKIEKHPNADRLSIVTIKGWSCIVGLNQYIPGDLVVFVPPDSIIPTDMIEKYKLDYLRKGGRVKTCKLRKCISQGLVLDIPEGKDWKEGTDVANKFGITKYEAPVSQHLSCGGNTPSKKKRNPAFDVYTDIENVKHYNTLFKEGEEVVITEKIHGTNFRAGKLKRYASNWLWRKILRIFLGKYEFVYGSHKVQKTPMNRTMGFYGEDVYGKIAKKYNLKEIIPNDYIIYGEIYGPKIQELTYGMKDIEVAFFDVKYKDKYLNYQEFVNFCRAKALPRVPELYRGKFSQEKLQQYTQRNSTIDKLHMIEGCVVRPIIEGWCHSVGRKVLKSLNPEYLLSKKRTEFH